MCGIRSAALPGTTRLEQNLMARNVSYLEPAVTQQQPAEGRQNERADFHRVSARLPPQSPEHTAGGKYWSPAPPTAA